jgi:uncharacterized protein YbbC (DUF1343 family)
MFDKVTGSDKIRKEFGENYLYSDIEKMWEESAKSFKEESGKYYLYN